MYCLNPVNYLFNKNNIQLINLYNGEFIYTNIKKYVIPANEYRIDRNF